MQDLATKPSPSPAPVLSSLPLLNDQTGKEACWPMAPPFNSPLIPKSWEPASQAGCSPCRLSVAQRASSKPGSRAQRSSWPGPHVSRHPPHTLLARPSCIQTPSPHTVGLRESPERWIHSHTSSASDTWSSCTPFQHGPELHPGYSLGLGDSVCGVLNIDCLESCPRKDLLHSLMPVISTLGFIIPYVYWMLGSEQSYRTHCWLFG